MAGSRWRSTRPPVLTMFTRQRLGETARKVGSCRNSKVHTTPFRCMNPAEILALSASTAQGLTLASSGAAVISVGATSPSPVKCRMHPSPSRRASAGCSESADQRRRSRRVQSLGGTNSSSMDTVSHLPSRHRGAAGRRPRLRRTLQCPVDRRKERLPEPRSSSSGVARRDLNQARRVRQTCVQGTGCATRRLRCSGGSSCCGNRAAFPDRYASRT